MKISLIVYSVVVSLCTFSQLSVRIDNHVISTVDVSVTHFNNGDEIPVFASAEKAKYYCEKEKPACIKVGNSYWYNWYAVNDIRGISQSGWHVPTYNELLDLQYDCRENLQSVFDHENRNILPGNPSGKNEQEPFFNWWIVGENNMFADSYVEILKCGTSKGPINFEIVKKCDFYPVRLFDNNPQNSEAFLYFTKQKVFNINKDSCDWKIVINAQNCDWGQAENYCYGASKIELFSKIDSTLKYTIHAKDFNFSVDKNNQIISDLGFVFDDFNFDGYDDFGYGYIGNYDGLDQTVFLSSLDGKKMIFNKDFNDLFHMMEYTTCNFDKRTFEGINTFSYGFDAITYYLCPNDSLQKFSNYDLPKELAHYKINYPNLFVVSYYSREDNIIKSFDFEKSPYFTQKELNDIERGEFDKDSSYYFQFENTNINNLVEKIDSITFYDSYSKVIPSPFLLKEKTNMSEKSYLKMHKSFVSRSNNSLNIKCPNGENINFNNNNETGNKHLFYGETEDKKYWIIRSYGEYDYHDQVIINKETCRIDSIHGFPRFSPNGIYMVSGEYAEEEGIFGYFSLYKNINGEFTEIGSVFMDDLEYSFAPYDMFWLDDKTIYIKQLKTKGLDENDYFFEYAKITIDCFKIKK